MLTSRKQDGDQLFEPCLFNVEFTAIDESRRWHATMKLVASLQSGQVKRD